jgi:hypothetical protein
MRLRGGWEAVGWRSEWNANFRRGSFNRGAIRPRRFPPERGVPPVHSSISAEPAGSVPEPSLNLPARSVQTRLTGNRVMGICEEMMGITNISSILRLSFEG